jgi:hypothetical protein
MKGDLHRIKSNLQTPRCGQAGPHKTHSANAGPSMRARFRLSTNSETESSEKCGSVRAEG